MQLDSRLVKPDLITLIEAVRDWQRVGDRELHMLQMVKDMPYPPEDHEAYDWVSQMKKQYKEREREIKEASELRAEKATLLAAKLYLAKNELSIQGMLDLAEMITTNEESLLQEDPQTEIKLSPKSDAKEELDLAYEYIRDVGIWKNFSDFRAERRGEVTSENS